MASLASLLVPGAQVAQQDYSWLNGIANTIGGAIDQRSENRSFGKLADRIGQGGSQGAMMASVAPQAPMMGGARQQPPMTAPVAPVGRADIGEPNDIYGSFMGAVRQGGIQNPYALSAIAATGRAESGWSPQNANRRWSDPSQSGQAGTAGGILSWRNERLSNLEQFARQRGEDPSNISPQTQAAFFLAEDPELVQRLNSAQSPEEAITIMNNAWRFAGYDQPGGEAARRRAMATNYYAQEFRNAPGQEAISGAMGQTGQPLSDAAFDARFGGSRSPEGMPSSAQPGTIMQGPDGQTYQYAQTTGMAGATGDQGWIRTSMQPTQVADASGGFQNVPGTQPIPQGGADIATIQFMLRDPNLREMGLKLWQQNVTGSTGEPWQFVQAPDGTLLRANQQTGAVESIGRFAEPQDATSGGTEYGLTPIYGTDANGNTVLVQVAKDGTSIQTPLPEGFRPTPGISNSDLGTSIITRNNRTGQIIDQRDKDLAGAEREKAIGGAEGEAIASASGDARSAQNALDLVASIRNDPNRQRGTGFSSLGNRIPGTAGFDFQQKVNQATSGAFLTAIQQLRGMGALSNAEGQTATQAVTRLNTAASEEEFLAALADYEKVVRQGLEAAQRRMPQQQSQPAGEPSIDDLLDMYGE